MTDVDSSDTFEEDEGRHHSQSGKKKVCFSMCGKCLYIFICYLCLLCYSYHFKNLFRISHEQERGRQTQILLCAV
jgi:hypothetical protein